MATVDPNRSLFDPVEDPATSSPCARCGLVPGRKFPALILCGQCKKVYYCSRWCQRKDWANHGKVCEAPPEEKKKREEEALDNGNGTKDRGVQADLK